MHTFPDYHAPDEAAMLAFVLERPFAIAATNGDGAPIATHVPIVPPTGARIERLEGATLWGHMGRANRHWRRMAQRPETLLIHASSAAYVSAEHYRATPSVPTVDYAAVHLEGVARIVEDDELALEIVTQTVRRLEELRSRGLDVAPWDHRPSEAEFRRILGGIVAFEIEVTGAQAMFKLSQNQDAVVRDRIRAEERAPACPHADVAGLMGMFDAGYERRDHVPPREVDGAGRAAPSTGSSAGARP